MEYNDEIDFIPLKNLPDSGLKVFKYDTWKEGDPIRPNNVLIAVLDELEMVSLVGRHKQGGMVFASSESDIDEVKLDLVRFMQMLEEYEERD